jgi:phosphoenolpyruvate carboxykinase (GTP)
MTTTAHAGAGLTAPSFVKNKKLIAWVADMVALCKPAAVHWCDGSQAEYQQLCQALVDAGHLHKTQPGPSAPTPSSLAPTRQTWPGWKTAPTSARRRKKTRDPPTTGWTQPRCAKPCNRCLTAAWPVAPCTWCRFPWGPLGSPIAHIGIELSDSAYVAVNMKIMTRMGQAVYEVLGEHGEFVPCVHTVGAPLKAGDKDVSWPCNKTKYIVHYPETREIWSYGSGYGGNALLGKKCFALRIASNMGRDQGWLAEHMLILGVTNPEGKNTTWPPRSQAPVAKPISPC